MADIDTLISQMTLEEKAKMLSGADFWHLKGVDRLGIAQVMVTDGPHGLRKQDTKSDHMALNESVKAVCYPAACATACSFDRELLHRMGELLGEECQAEEISVLLGPGANIKRSPLCGRNFEYFSEDPYATGELAAAFIQGVQSKHVGTSLKHYAMNNQEHRRMTTSANVDERTMREIYLAGFEKAVKAGKPWTVMCSYNRVNGVYASENKQLLRDILKDEWGFDGFTVTDWGACNDHVKGVEAGMDVEMPYSGPANDEKLITAMKNGEVHGVDEAVKRILTIAYRYLDNRIPNTTYDWKAHHEQARRIAGQCMVLLKNEGNILPLSSEQKIAFIGSYAEHPRYQGAGSSQINPHTILSAVEAVMGIANVQYAQGFDDHQKENAQALREEAVAVAKACDAAVIFAGLPASFESEGFDRDHMRMPEEQNELIEAVAAANPNTVVVLHNGAPVEMPWLSSVKGLLEAYLGGQAVGGATVDVLFGHVNPSGKLAETFPVKLADNPSYLNFPGDGDNVNYREGLYVGYRYYDQKEMDVLFPFGYGLSYTTFAYSNLRVDESRFASEDRMMISADVTNTGTREGKEIVQLYIASRHTGISRAPRELKDFAKINLRPSETKTVTFALDHRAFAYYETSIHNWYVENGDYTVAIGASSRDIRLSDRVTISDSTPMQRTFTINSTLNDILDDPIGAQHVDSILEELNKALGNDSDVGKADDPHSPLRMFTSMPLRAIQTFVQSAASDEMIQDLLHTINAPR